MLLQLLSLHDKRSTSPGASKGGWCLNMEASTGLTIILVVLAMMCPVGLHIHIVLLFVLRGRELSRCEWAASLCNYSANSPPSFAPVDIVASIPRKKNRAFFWLPPLWMYLSSSYSASLAPLVPSPQNCSVEFHGMACRTPRCSPRSTATRCTLSSTPPGRLCTAAPTTPPPSRRGALCTTSPTAPHLPSVYPGDLPLICRVGHTPDPSRSTVRSTNPSSLREVPERIVRTCSAFSFARAFLFPFRCRPPFADRRVFPVHPASDPTLTYG